jgi:hypothetical protein
MIMRKVRPLTFSPGPGPYHLRGSITWVERERCEVACATGLVNATFAHVLAAECLTFSPGPGLGRGFGQRIKGSRALAADPLERYAGGCSRCLWHGIVRRGSV